MRAWKRKLPILRKKLLKAFINWDRRNTLLALTEVYFVILVIGSVVKLNTGLCHL